MIDIATWRARIGLYRVRAGPSGTRRAKVLPSDGATDWSLLSTITVEQVVTVIYVVIITVLLVLPANIERYYSLHVVNPGQQLVETGEILHNSVVGLYVTKDSKHLVLGLRETQPRR